MKSTLAIVLASLVVSPDALGDFPEFQSGTAKKAVSDHIDRLNVIERQYKEMLAKERKQLTDSLVAAAKLAIEKRDFAEVQRISEFVERTEKPEVKQNEQVTARVAEAPKPPKSPPSVERKFTGRTYEIANNANRTWTFGPGGALFVNKGKIGWWAPIGDQYVITLIKNRLSVDFFRFSPDGSKATLSWVGNVPQPKWQGVRAN